MAYNEGEIKDIVFQLQKIHSTPLGDLTNSNVLESLNSLRASLNQGVPKNQIIVTQENAKSIFSSPIDSSKEYFIDGVVNLSGLGVNIEVPSAGIELKGYSFNTSKLICSDSGFTLFSSPTGGSGDILGKDFSVEVTGASSKVWDIIGNTGSEAIELHDFNYNDCTSLGVIDKYRQGLETGTGRFGGTPELTLKGVWSGGFLITTSIARGLTDGNYSLFKAGTGFIMSSRFRSNQNIDLPASASFLDFSSSNFVNSSTLQLEGCIISRNGVFNAGDTNLTPNITSKNIISYWKDNNGLLNTFLGGQSIVSSETATVISVAGTFVDLAGTFSISDLEHFDSLSGGQLRYLGNSQKEFRIQGQLVLDSNQNNEVDLKIVVYRSLTTSFEDEKTTRRTIDRLQGGRDVAYFGLIDSFILNKNDYVKLQVANVNDTNNITAEIDSFYLVEEK